jgi:TonB family protein
MKVVLGPGNNVNGTVRLRLGSVSESITVAGEFRASSAAQQAVEPPANPVTAADYLDLARVHYAQRQYAEAQAATERALQLLRPADPQAQFEARPPADPSGPVRVGGSVREPKKIKDVKPAYPNIALLAGVQGIVIIEAVIDREGLVRDTRVLRSTALLDQAALDAVREWRFTPTQLNGVPVEVVMTVTVNFSGR